MKKVKVTPAARVNADVLAKNLRRTLGRDKAYKVANNLAKNLGAVNGDDFNSEFFSMSQFKKSLRYWEHVRNVIAKFKN